MDIGDVQLLEPVSRDDGSYFRVVYENKTGVAHGRKVVGKLSELAARCAAGALQMSGGVFLGLADVKHVERDFVRLLLPCLKLCRVYKGYVVLLGQHVGMFPRERERLERRRSCPVRAVEFQIISAEFPVQRAAPHRGHRIGHAEVDEHLSAQNAPGSGAAVGDDKRVWRGNQVKETIGRLATRCADALRDGHAGVFFWDADIEESHFFPLGNPLPYFIGSEAGGLHLLLKIFRIAFCHAACAVNGNITGFEPISQPAAET